MSEHQSQQSGSETITTTTTTKLPVECTDRGLFDFLDKKEEKKPQEDVVMIDSETPTEKKDDKHTLMEKLHRSHSNSSSSSDDEDEGGEKKRKKGIKEKIKDRISSCENENGATDHGHNVTPLPVEKCNEVGNTEDAMQAEEKKGFLDRIKEKLPCQHKKSEEINKPAALPDSAADDGNSPGAEVKEKKGIFEKIKEKLPGGNQKTDQEEKAKEN